MNIKLVHILLDPNTSTTVGVAIVTLSEEAKVPSTLERLEGFEISKGQPLRAFPFEVAESIIEDSLAYSEEKNSSSSMSVMNDPTNSIINRTNQRNWMNEEVRMEQLLTRYDDETEVYWIDPLDPNPKLYYGGEREKVSGKNGAI